MDVEYLAAAAEPANDVEYLFARIVEHLCHRPLAEIQAVIGALMHLDKSLHAVGRAENTSNAAVTRWSVRVVRMTR